MLNGMKQLISGAKPGDIVVIQYAGHGTQVKDLDGDETDGQDEALVPVDFGTGALGDMGCHGMDGIFRALKLGPPTSVEGNSSRVSKETYPLASTVTYHFPARGEMPPLKLVWYDGGLRPARPLELEEGKAMGANGKLTFARAYDIDVGDKTMWWMGMVSL